MSSKSDWSWRTAFTSSWRICCFSSLFTFNSSLKLCCKTHKQVLYIVGFFCRCFHSNTMFFLGNCFSTPKINLSLMNKVTFVSNNVHEHFFAGESVNILKPLIYVFKWLPAGNVVSDYNTVSIMIITVCNWAETFLASCIPHLQLQKKKTLSTWCIKL